MRLTIDAETKTLVDALDRLSGPMLSRHLLEAARVTADRIATGAQARVARRSGRTAAGIRIQRSRVGQGYVVQATNPEHAGVPGWLEHGTKFMAPRPFFFAEARLEAGSYERRIREAIQAAITEAGLGT